MPFYQNAARAMGVVTRTLRWCVLTGAVPLFGCGATFQSPAAGGRPWYEAKSSHFVVRTDAGADEARDWLLEYERIWAYYEKIAFPLPEQPSGVTDVVMFH